MLFTVLSVCCCCCQELHAVLGQVSTDKGMGHCCHSIHSWELGRTSKHGEMLNFTFSLPYRVVTLCFLGCKRKLLALRTPGSLFFSSLSLSSCIKMKGRASAFTANGWTALCTTIGLFQTDHSLCLWRSQLLYMAPSQNISKQQLYKRKWTTQCKAHMDSLFVLQCYKTLHRSSILMASDGTSFKISSENI